MLQARFVKRRSLASQARLVRLGSMFVLHKFLCHLECTVWKF